MHIDHTKNIIEIKNISSSYGDETILNDINLSIHKGDYLGIVGSNGSGKTTLLRTILGLLSFKRGTIKLFGQDISVFKDWSKIGYVPQKVINFDNNFPVTVEEVVMMGRYGKLGLFKRINDKDKQEVYKALEQVEMLPYRNRPIGDLSGGQQQRVFIARALTGNPEIIFLDEPTVGVEKDIKEKFYKLLHDLNEKLKLTIVIVTHDIESMSHEAMHVACIKDHTLIFHESIDDLFKESHGIISRRL
ncbi:MAG: Zinc uptake system ATP-binding protein zurA [Candidatus Nomurabacteria bacterium GW2011_GWE1_32_28]|uniref:Zinc uptake system ATP-binding protein zurA n=1 Tax=Candidatus Nomurabacteria bacterium GW2011_GWF1_31_48 TaxID=1618767 RepID=A0A0F9YFK0_9BACT|nr:MAG: Zinc uptake system ATP-binding protein zurA [Candidatus Nomurabacteria bacterium GW2011_GWF2_30_133]KKP29086.1 MAG: Zinc uptake system ATP-binding protein zurA [Candidatus Nomurabacteria bacterium GW2011_GWE2_31_40]KKP30504.1 MAG: Zinc uptake system ATP-binding protein zurA [Candidatus Nomurabacteria bacterium GW2011_GWF1_31_48]KKP34989.1 MAG: Zinc uptake system ATP-binding protein zurA [Candidatus Nomurabacteria bacterium GW2011_GWE1_32_28]HAS80643.1 zinc ABC transporter ATP-binding pr